jgi:hypothetical protein
LVNDWLRTKQKQKVEMGRLSRTISGETAADVAMAAANRDPIRVGQGDDQRSFPLRGKGKCQNLGISKDAMLLGWQMNMPSARP